MRGARPMTWRVLWLAVLIGGAGLPAVRADEPERLLLPHISQVEIISSADGELALPYLRTSRYAVWQFYGVDRTGHFRPRVIYQPDGAYFLYNGERFPWVTTHALDFMPYVLD